MIYLVYLKSTKNRAILQRAYKKLKAANHYVNRKNNEPATRGQYFVTPVALRDSE